MRTFLIIAVFLLILITFFVIGNSHSVMINFLFWEVESSLTVIIFSSFAGGAITGLLFSLPAQWKKNKKIKLLNTQLKAAQESVTHKEVHHIDQKP